MQDLQIFNNDAFGEVRVASINNEPYFCLADVCKALDIKNPRDCKTRLNDKGLQIVNLNTVGNADGIISAGNPNATFINEANLYKCIFQSRTERAEAFQDWVTSEVLPSIRKTGQYNVAFPQTYVEALEQFVEQVKENERLALENKAKQTYIEKNEENVQFAKQCAVSTTSISMEEFSKELFKKHNFRLGKNQCYKWFREKGYLRDNNLPYQQFLNRGWFEVQKTQSWRKDGTCYTFPLVYIKDVAQQMFFYEILNDFRNEKKNGLF